MHLLPYSLALSCLLSLAPESLALPAPSPPSAPLSIPLVRRRPQRKTTDEWLQFHKDAVVAKYGLGSGQQKRASGFNLYVFSVCYDYEKRLSEYLLALPTKTRMYPSTAR